MLRLDLQAGGASAETAAPSRARRAAILAVALAVTVAAFVLAFLLGALYFESRRYSAHEGRLERMLMQNPNVAQVTEGLRDDGSPLVAAPRDESELRAVAARLGGPKQKEIVDQGRRWPVTRVFRASDMFYFIYFDAGGTMRGFTCVST